MQTIINERQVPHPPEKVWRALTDQRLLAKWMMDNDFEPVVGRKFSFRTKPMPNWNGVVNCEVLSLEPNRRLSYAWNSTGEIVTWTLTPTDSGGTLLRMEHSGFGPDQKANYQGANYGWQRFLGALEKVLAEPV
jgi:uncharacterized protein YndB with AHSA1/START domain